jgi:hypothetical protein
MLSSMDISGHYDVKNTSYGQHAIEHSMSILSAHSAMIRTRTFMAIIRKHASSITSGSSTAETYRQGGHQPKAARKTFETPLKLFYAQIIVGESAARYGEK